MKINIKKLSLILLGLAISFLGWAILLKSDLELVSNGWELRSSIFSLLLILYYFIVWRKMKFKVICPRFFILLSMLLFHISLVIVVGLNWHEYDEYTMLYRYGEQNSCDALFFCNIIILFYVIGLVIFSNKKNSIIIITNNDNVRSEERDIVCRQIGIILLAISIVPTIYSNIYQIMLKVQYGYKDGVWGSSTTLFGIPLGWFLKLFLPSILLLITSYKNNKNTCKKIILLACSYYIIFMFLTGRKGNTIQNLCPIIILYWYYIRNKFKFTHIVLGYLGIWLVTVVTKSRDMVIDSNFWISTIEIIKNSNPISDLMYEMGGTIKAVIQMKMAIPKTGSYMYGLTYPAGLIKSICDGINLEIFDLDKYADFSVYLSLPERGSLLNSSVYAMGGSCIAEWWWNFGWLSIITSIFFSFLVVKYEKRMFSKINDPINLAIMCSVLYYILRYTRGYIIDTIWDPIFIIVVIKIMEKVLIRKIKK